MMEVIGAVASFIAIGQAIAVLPKIASTLKTFSNAEKYVASLAEEVTCAMSILRQVLCR